MIADEQVVSRPAVAAPAVTGSANPTGAQLAVSFPPRPAASSWPGTEATRSEVLARVLSAPFALDNRLSQQTRRLGVLAVLGWLWARSGGSWQQRWRASGAEDQPDWRRLVGSDRAKPPPHLSPGLLVLICADVIRPSLDWLLRFAPARHNLAVEMARTRDPSGAFTALTALCRSGRVGLQSQQQALTNVGIIMAAKGGPVEQVRVGDCVELLATVARTRATTAKHLNSPLFYQLLRAHGDLGPDAPAAIEMFSGRGQPSCEALIDRYRIACRPVRDMLVDYLQERQPSMDFSSLQRHAYLLGKLFWADLEAHHPGIDSLHLSRDVAAAWKQRVMFRTRTTTTPDREQVTLEQQVVELRVQLEERDQDLDAARTANRELMTSLNASRPTDDTPPEMLAQHLLRTIPFNERPQDLHKRGRSAAVSGRTPENHQHSAAGLLPPIEYEKIAAVQPEAA